MLTHPDHRRGQAGREDHEHHAGHAGHSGHEYRAAQGDRGWARLAAVFGSLPYRQLAGPASVFLFWPLRPPPRGRDGRDAGSAHAAG